MSSFVDFGSERFVAGACKLAGMKSRRWVLALTTAMHVASAGCASTQQADPASGGAAGVLDERTAGSTASGGATAGTGGASAGNAGGSACSEQPIPRRTEGTPLSLSLSLVMAGKPFVFGQPNALADGGSLVPLNFRFYVSEVQLLQSTGQAVPVDVVTAAGAPEPYGVHLFNAEDEQSSTLRVLAPAGDYSGLSFALGIELACNRQAPALLGEPLTDASQMTWPHTGGFLFLRYEGRYTGADGRAGAPSDLPTAVHMGGSIASELVPRVTIPGTLSIPDNGSLSRALNLAVDEMFKGATAEIDVSDVAVGFLSTPESIAGERLRRKLSDLHVFVLEP